MCYSEVDDDDDLVVLHVDEGIAITAAATGDVVKLRCGQFQRFAKGVFHHSFLLLVRDPCHDLGSSRASNMRFRVEFVLNFVLVYASNVAMRSKIN